MVFLDVLLWVALILGTVSALKLIISAIIYIIAFIATLRLPK